MATDPQAAWTLADIEAARPDYEKLLGKPPTPPPLPNPPDTAAHRNRWLIYLATAIIIPMVISFFSGPITLVFGILLVCLGYIWFTTTEQPGFYKQYDLQLQNYHHLLATYHQQQAYYTANFEKIRELFQEEARLIGIAREYNRGSREFFVKDGIIRAAKAKQIERIAILEKWVEAGYTEFKIKRDAFGQVTEHQLAADFRGYMLTIPNVPDWGLLRESQSPTVKLIIGDGQQFPAALPLLPPHNSDLHPKEPPPPARRYIRHPGALVGIFPGVSPSAPT